MCSSLLFTSTALKYPIIMTPTMTLRLTIAKTPEPVWIQVCSAIVVGECWLEKKQLTVDKQKGNEL